MAAALSAVAAQLRNSHRLPETPSYFLSPPPPFPLFQHTLQEMLSILPKFLVTVPFCDSVCTLISSYSIYLEMQNGNAKCLRISLQRLYLKVDYVLSFHLVVQ